MKIELRVGKNSYDAQVLCDGVDISRYVRSIDVNCEAGNIPRVRLDIMPEEVKVSLADENAVALDIVATLRETLKEMEAEREARKLATLQLTPEEMREACGNWSGR